MTVQPYTVRDVEQAEAIVRELHGIKGYDAWAERIAKALAAERERCAKIVEGRVHAHVYREWPQIGPGNRAQDSEIVRHCDKLAAVIRGTYGQPSPNPQPD